MRVHLDPNACFLCGLCTDICPAIFQIDGLELKLLHEQVPQEHVVACYEAAAACPRAAIWVAEPPRRPLVH